MLKKIFERLKRWLKRQMASIDPTERSYISIMLVVIMAFISVARVGELLNPPPQGMAKHADGIRMPALQRAGNGRERSGREMKAFENFLDSLRADRTGKKAYDELLKKEPGLADSIRKMENQLQ